MTEDLGGMGMKEVVLGMSDIYSYLKFPDLGPPTSIMSLESRLRKVPWTRANEI